MDQSQRRYRRIKRYCARFILQHDGAEAPAAAKYCAFAIRIECALIQEIGRLGQVERPDAQIHLQKDLRNPCACYKAHGPPAAIEMFRLRGVLLAVEDRLKRSVLFRRIFYVFLEVTELRLNLAEVLLNIAFCFQRLVAHDFAGSFLYGSFRLFDAALNLIFVDAHDVLLITDTGKRPARSTQKKLGNSPPE
jgi:hypothetical protein